MSTRVRLLALTILLAGFAPSAHALSAQNGINLNGINLNGINLNGINLNGINLNGINLNGINLNGINLNGINLNGINLNGINLNGINPNGINLNGINLNGINLNGINLNGINLNGLREDAFQAWFARNPSSSDMLMKYVTECALPSGNSLSFTQAGKTYVWTGVFGLAPTWGSGAEIPMAEQELVSACVAAHANAKGKHVQISVRGYRADGSMIPVSREETAGFTFREAAYFGNLFDGSGLFVAPERNVLDPSVSTPRGCAAERGVPGHCGPMVQAGQAVDRCKVGSDGQTYSACTVNGRAFRPLQVFLRESDVTRVAR